VAAPRVRPSITARVTPILYVSVLICRCRRDRFCRSGLWALQYGVSWE
jgi:hypothetical protein